MIKPLKDSGNISPISRPATPPPAYEPVDPALPQYPARSPDRDLSKMPGITTRPAALIDAKNNSISTKNPNSLNLLKTRLKNSENLQARDRTPAPRNLSYMNLAAGVGDLKNLTTDDIPDMMARITFDHPKAVNAAQGSKYEMVLEKMSLRASSELNDAREKTNDFIREYDRRLDKPLTKETRADFQKQCLDMLEGHQAEINESVAREWDMQKFRNSNRRQHNANFALDVAVKGTKFSVSVASAATVVLSPASITASAITGLSLARTVYKFSQDREAAMKAMIKGDEALNKKLSSEAGKESLLASGQQVMKELLVSTPIPFADKLAGPTVKKQENAVKDFLNKSARWDRQVKNYYKKCTSDLAKIEKYEYETTMTEASGEENTKSGKDIQMEEKKKNLMDCLEALEILVKQVDEDNQTFVEYHNRCKAYEKGHLPSGTLEASATLSEATRCVAVAAAIQKLAELAVANAV